ncbi:MAG: hypothetical protein QXZ43_01310 [Candidatus Aenigmatarchaeota archaeon]
MVSRKHHIEISELAVMEDYINVLNQLSSYNASIQNCSIAKRNIL